MISSLIAVALGLVVALAAPGPTGAQDRIVIAQGVDIIAMDPMISNVTPTRNVTNAIFQPLVDWDSSGKLVPVLAESYRLVNPTTWEFKLRRNVRFQNGEPFNAAAVAFSIERLNTNPKSKLGYLKPVKTVEVVDDHTVRLITQAPYPVLDKQLYAAAIVPPNYVKQVGDDELNRRPIGTGPYRLARWVRDDQIVLESWKDFWRGPAAVKTIVFRAIPDDSARVASLEAGETDLIVNVPPHLAEELKKSAKYHVQAVPSVRTIFLKINALEESPFRDVRVRRAANMAIDVDRLVKGILGGYGTPLNSELSPLIFGFDPKIRRYPYDPAQSRKLLAEAGYPNGFDTILNTPTGRFLKDREIAEAVAGGLREAGIRAQLRVHEIGTLLRTVYAKKMPGLTLFSWGLPNRDADAWLRFSLHSDGTHAYVRNADLDRLVTKGASEMEPEVRAVAYREALRIAHDLAVHIPLYYQHDIYATRARLSFTARADEFIPVYELGLKR